MWLPALQPGMLPTTPQKLNQRNSFDPGSLLSLLLFFFHTRVVLTPVLILHILFINSPLHCGICTHTSTTTVFLELKGTSWACRPNSFNYRHLQLCPRIFSRTSVHGYTRSAREVAPPSNNSQRVTDRFVSKYPSSLNPARDDIEAYSTRPTRVPRLVWTPL